MTSALTTIFAGPALRRLAGPAGVDAAAALASWQWLRSVLANGVA